MSETMERLFLRRRTEDNVKYWMEQAGWYDDDARMAEYNNKVSNANWADDDNGNVAAAGDDATDESNIDFEEVKTWYGSGFIFLIIFV